MQFLHGPFWFGCREEDCSQGARNLKNLSRKHERTKTRKKEVDRPCKLISKKALFLGNFLCVIDVKFRDLGIGEFRDLGI